MELILTPFFAVALMVRFIVALIELSIFLLPIPRWMLLVLSAFICGLCIGGIAYISLTAVIVHKKLDKLNQIRSTLQQEKQYWDDLLKTQPLDRDLLYNRGQVSCDLGETEDCELFIEKARQLEPAHPLFAQ